MIIQATAPTRIDFAGGTLDLYPLYLFEEGGLTVNGAIDLRSKVQLETRSDNKIIIFAEDIGEKEEFDSIKDITFDGILGLIKRIIKFYSPQTGLNVTTRNSVPKGSGLGASSSLLIALSGALNHLNKTNLTNEQLVDYGANLEAQAIRIPTGKQDYLAALYGGINALWFGVKGFSVEPLNPDNQLLEELEKRIILSFTGEPHFSAITNWQMFKNYLDKEGSAEESLKKIKQTAYKVRESLIHQDFDALATALKEEWENRKQLADNVTTDMIEKLISKTEQEGALANKICGAGGGGCMITMCEPDNKKHLEKVLAEEGAQVLEFSFARKELTIEGS